MSNAIKCESGNGKGKFYHVSPSGSLVLVASATVDEAKAKAGWRLAAQADIDAAIKAEAARSKPAPAVK